MWDPPGPELEPMSPALAGGRSTTAPPGNNWLCIIFKENSSLPSDADSILVAFNSNFINGLNQDLSLLVKRTKMEWETMSTLDLVTLPNQLSPTLPPERETDKILNFSSPTNEGS